MTARLFESSLPVGWAWVSLGQCYRITKKPRGFNPSGPNLIPFAPMEGVPKGGAIEIRYDLRKQEAIASGVYFERGDILVARITPSFENGKQGKADDLPAAFGFASTELIPLQPISEADPRYIFYYLLHPEVRGYLTSKMEGSTARQRVPDEALLGLATPVPPIGEQNGIANVLANVQRAIAIEERLGAITRELKQAAMHQLFTRGLWGEEQKETEYGPIPMSWRTIPLGGSCSVQGGVTKGRTIDPNEALEVPYLRVANVQDGRLDLTDIKRIVIRRAELQRYLLRDKDVLLTEGGDLDKLGRGFIWRGQIPNCVHQNHIFAVRPDPNVVLPEYLAYLVQSPYGKAYFLTVAHKTTNLATINSTKLKAFPILAPPLDEQREIVSALEAIDNSLTLHERKRSALTDLFNTLLQDLMSGRVRVKAKAGAA